MRKYFWSNGIYTAVDVGVKSIRVVELEVKGGKHHLGARGTLPFPSGALKDLEQNKGMLARLIERTVESAGVRVDRVVSAVPHGHVVTRIITIPKMPLNELAQAIKWEAVRLFPESADNMVIRHVVLDEMEHNGQRQFRVLLALARDSFIRCYHSLFTMAGLNLVVLELQGIALWRIFKGMAGKGKMDGPLAVVDIDAGFAQLIIIKNKKISYYKTFSADTPYSLTVQVSKEIRQVRDRHSSINIGEEIDRLVLSGAGAAIADELREHFRDEPGLVVEPGYPVDDLEPSFNVAMGLALRGAEG